MYDEFRDRLMVYSGDPLTKILKRSEEYTSVKTLYVISILDGYLKVNGEDKPLERLLPKTRQEERQEERQEGKLKSLRQCLPTR